MSTPATTSMPMNGSARQGTPQYRRIRWQNGGALSRASLWLADDHVLQISSSVAQERYQRFYLRDIKAIMIGEGYSQIVGGSICGIAALFLGVITFFTMLPPGPGKGAPVAWVFFAISLVMTVLFVWRGRTVKLYAVTELQTVLWRSVARKWQAEKLLAELTPLISAAQADLVRAEPAQPPRAAEPTPEDRMAEAVAAAVQQTTGELGTAQSQPQSEHQPLKMPSQPELPQQPQLPSQPQISSQPQSQPNPDGGANIT